MDGMSDYEAANLFLGREGDVSTLDVLTMGGLLEFNPDADSDYFSRLGWELKAFLEEVRSNVIAAQERGADLSDLGFSAEDERRIVFDFILAKAPLRHGRWEVSAMDEDGLVRMDFLFGFDRLGWTEKVKGWVLARACEQLQGVARETFTPKGPRPTMENSGGVLLRSFALGDGQTDSIVRRVFRVETKDWVDSDYCDEE
jgi:hypothetical protein